MDNLSVEVYVPAIGTTYDVLIPRRAYVYELLPLIIKAVVKLSDGLFIPVDAVLCCGSTGRIFGSDMSVYNMNLINGSRLMLI